MLRGKISLRWQEYPTMVHHYTTFLLWTILFLFSLKNYSRDKRKKGINPEIWFFKIIYRSWEKISKGIEKLSSTNQPDLVEFHRLPYPKSLDTPYFPVCIEHLPGQSIFWALNQTWIDLKGLSHAECVLWSKWIEVEYLENVTIFGH
jgi:hypothetical protein